SNAPHKTFENSKTDDSSKEDRVEEGVSYADYDHKSPKKSKNEDEFSFSDMKDDNNDLSGFK
ncbi:Hypothetical predicted protein, partial [Olea europaea subsp. europaea]